MIKLKSLVAGLLLGAFFVGPSDAQSGIGQLGAGQVFGNATASQGLGSPVLLDPLLTRNFCGTTANFLANIGGTWQCASLSAGLAFTGSVLGIGTNGVGNGMLRQSGALSLIGRSANSTGNVADISAVAASSCAFIESGSTIICGQLATAGITNNAVTNAKLATAADGTIKSNISGGVAAPSDNTITSVFDKLGATQGNLFYRNAGTWVPLAPGTNGQLLTSGGAAANLSWTTASGTGTVTSVGITPSTSLSVSGSPVVAAGNITVTYRPPTIQVFQGSVTATYTTPANVSLIKVTLCGATGGGGGSGTGSTGGTGGTPAASTFAGGTLSCTGGAGGVGNGNVTAAGVCTGTGTVFPGNTGLGAQNSVTSVFLNGGIGGITPFVATQGGTGGAFSGAGNTGSGGGSSACIINYIPAPSATYGYVLQGGGAAGAAGTSGLVGLAGAPARLIVEEF